MIVYLITNIITGKQYVGQTVQTLERRWKRHCWESTKQKSKMAITKAIAKYGPLSFKVSLLEVCDSQEGLNKAEQSWIEKLKTLYPLGYNLTTGGNSQGHLSSETKKKISTSNKGRKVSLETRQKLSASHKGWVPSTTTREKWKKAFTGRKPNEEVVKARVAKVVKTYAILTPENEKLIVTNLRQFCRENKLNYPKMNLVVNGKLRHYKNWRSATFALAESVLSVLNLG